MLKSDHQQGTTAVGKVIAKCRGRAFYPSQPGVDELPGGQVKRAWAGVRSLAL